jgi:NAD(P)-dependent dehydrogenase (short-subunit alcohol dehydrogenase family)
VNGQLDLQLGDPLARGDQLCMISAGHARHLAGIGQLPPPGADHRRADIQVSSDLRCRPPGSEQVQDLATELQRVTPGHIVLHELLMVDHPATRLRRTRGTSESPDSPGRFITGVPFLGPYAAAEHGVVGIAMSPAKHHIAVNPLHPTGGGHAHARRARRPRFAITREPELGALFVNTCPIEIVEARDISNAVLFLTSYKASYVTGLEFTVDGGNTIR